MSDSAEPQGQTVDLASLSAQQLGSVKKQLDDELEHLTTSFSKLRSAQAKFRECLRSIKDGVSPKTAGKSLLVPLTTSLYVPGMLADSESVIVDVGTGFYVEKSIIDALAFYALKIEDLGKNLKDLESIVQGKANNLRMVEDVLRQKVILGNGKATP
ncbi:subunit of tubulin prefoldin [Ptychographa xylographoides]|nr:subunit of tubulin prefoldin [Ptychographa xylographoides]